jgi:hypothetical protein
VSRANVSALLFVARLGNQAACEAIIYQNVLSHLCWHFCLRRFHVPFATKLSEVRPIVPFAVVHLLDHFAFLTGVYKVCILS